MQVARKIVRHCDALHDGVHGEMVFVPKELECVAEGATAAGCVIKIF
jgi:hypothetical protein